MILSYHLLVRLLRLMVRWKTFRTIILFRYILEFPPISKLIRSLRLFLSEDAIGRFRLTINCVVQYIRIFYINIRMIQLDQIESCNH